MPHGTGSQQSLSQASSDSSSSTEHSEGSITEESCLSIGVITSLLILDLALGLPCLISGLVLMFINSG